MPLLLLLAAGALLWTVWVYERTRPSPGARWRTILIVLRVFSLLLLLLAVAGPVLTRLVQREAPAELVVVMEDSGSMAIQDCSPSPDPADTTLASRWAQAQAIVENLAEALTSGQSRVEVSVLRGNGLAPLREFTDPDFGLQSPANHGTDLARLLGQVRTRLVGRPARAVILVSDGQETTGRQQDGPRRGRSDGRGVNAVSDFMTNLFVVGVGDPQGPPDRVLVDLRYPDLAFKGDEVVIEVGIMHRYAVAADHSPATVRLRAADGSMLAEETVEASEDLTRLELSFQPQEAGPQVLHLELTPLDNERFLANNQASLAINVRQERARVLLLAGQPGWDARFLAQAVAREGRLDMATVYASPRGLVFADSLNPWREPGSAAEWLAWDAVVLTGWQDPLAFDWQVLAQAVRQGLGVMFLPGPQAAGVGNMFSAVPGPRLQELLPVRSQDWQWSVGSYFLEIPKGGVQHPILSGLETGQVAGTSGLSLQELPPLRRIARVQPKAGALTLLSARAADVQSGALDPVLVVDTRQLGRLVWVGGRRLWELAFWELAGEDSGQGAGQEHAGRGLLRNLLVWTASGDEDSGLALVGHRTMYQEGETIRLAAKWRDMRGRPIGDRDLSVELRSFGTGVDTTAVRTFALQTVPGSSGLAETTLPPLPPGSYSVQLLGAGDPAVHGRRESLFVTDHSIEGTQVRLNERRLLQIAGRSGGSYFQGGQPEQIEDLRRRLLALDWTGQKNPVRNRYNLMASWPFFALVVLLLSVEWFLRRRKDLL